MKINNILMICSWVRHDSNVGIFFREQANQLSSTFNIYLASFSPKHLGIRTFLKTRSLFKIEEVKTPEGLLLFYVSFPSFYFFPNRLNASLKNVAIKKLNRILNTKNLTPNLIHAQSIFDAGFWANRFYKQHGIPYIITEHNQVSFANKSISDFKTVLEILDNSKTNCVVSLDKIRQFATNGIFGEFINIGNSVDETIFNCIGRTQNGSSFNILTVGAYHPIKDQKTILSALKKLENSTEHKNLDISFTWIGFDGWGQGNEIAVKNLIQGFDFKKVRINLIKSADRQFIANEMKGSDIFILGSISEGMPVAVIESLACGTPVISTNCGGVDEIITNENGIIVPIQDYNSICFFLEKIINQEIEFNPQLISKIIIENFGRIAYSKKMEEIYFKTIL